jgi:hypothetical protein
MRFGDAEIGVSPSGLELAERPTRSGTMAPIAPPPAKAPLFTWPRVAIGLAVMGLGFAAAFPGTTRRLATNAQEHVTHLVGSLPYTETLVRVAFDVKPMGSTLFLDGKPINRSAIDLAPDTVHALTVVAPGYATKEIVFIAEGQSVKVKLARRSGSRPAR